MTVVSPAVQRICDAATRHFSIKGYDGASLNEIAGMVGIRKASLYSHFAGKDELFSRVLHDAVAVETGFVGEILDGAPGPGGPGSAYPAALARHHERSVHLRYLLRTVYLPPASLRQPIDTAYLGFLESLAGCFRRQLGLAFPGIFSQADEAMFERAYVGIVESLFVEITYAAPETMERRREALWSVFTDSLAARARR